MFSFIRSSVFCAAHFTYLDCVVWDSLREEGIALHMVSFSSVPQRGPWSRLGNRLLARKDRKRQNTWNNFEGGLIPAGHWAATLLFTPSSCEEKAHVSTWRQLDRWGREAGETNKPKLRKSSLELPAASKVMPKNLWAPATLKAHSPCSLHPLKPPSPFFLYTIILWFIESPFSQFGSAVPAVSPSLFFLSIFFPAGKTNPKKERLDSVEALPSNIPNTDVLSTLLSSQIQNIAPHTGCSEESYLHLNQTKYSKKTQSGWKAKISICGEFLMSLV